MANPDWTDPIDWEDRPVTTKPNDWTLPAAIEQIDACGFECEAGPLANNVAYRWLRAAAKDGPEFFPGQWVWFQIEAEAAGKTLTQWVRFCIVGCQMDSSETSRSWTYSLSYDPPAPWHYGTTHFHGVRGDKLRLERPEVDEAKARAEARVGEG